MSSNGNFSVSSAWRKRVLVASLFSIFVLVVYYQTTWSMVSTWWNLETFAHGFLILPITLWMIWERRAQLQEITPSTSPLALLAMVVAGLSWFVGSLANVQVVQQFALIGLLISGVWVTIGTQAARRILFPLAYLFFAVPVGEDLVAPMMEFTASFTVELIKLTGIPVYREGLYFSLPSGNWSVVKACSGIRYLIASVTLGCFFAYLTYQSLAKRLVFIAFSIIVPIIANGLRAYIIVMLGHMSDMTIATGVDHLVYGWVFFGLVMLLLFWVGGKFKDPEPTADAQLVAKAQQDYSGAGTTWQNTVVGLAALIVMVFPAAAMVMAARDIPIPDQTLSVSGMESRWQESADAFWVWKPLMYGADRATHQYFQEGQRFYSLSVGQYLDQRQGVEMVSYSNRILDKDLESWRQIEQKTTDLELQNGTLRVTETVLSGEGRQLLTYSWYRVGDHYTASPYVAKFYEIIETVGFSDQGSAKIVVAVSTKQGDEHAGEALTGFLEAALPEIEAALAMTVVGGAK